LNTGRRERKGYAKDAKEDKKEMPSLKIGLAPNGISSMFFGFPFASSA
jgi:hypothetical protein